MVLSRGKLDIFNEPLFENSVVSYEEHTYKPYGSPLYKNSDEIRINIQFQDIAVDISESYIYIEGTFEPSDPAKSCYLDNNALAFLFDEIRYEIGGEHVAVVRKPGITSFLKTIVSYGDSQKKFLQPSGWGLEDKNQFLWDKTSKIFHGKLPLKQLMGFAEDYNKGIFNVKQELICVIARTFNDCYVGEVDAKIALTKLEWKVRHIIPEDKEKIKILSKINKGGNNATVKVAYRMWDLYELPSLRTTSSDVWMVRTSTNLEKPRYIIIGFQSGDNSGRWQESATELMNADITDIRVYLNSTVFPYERWNLTFDKNLAGAAYYEYVKFQSSYYGREIADPMMSYREFIHNPVFVIDTSHQSDSIKTSTVDIKLEFYTRKNKFPAGTKVYALIIHDSLLTYNLLTGAVQTKISY